MNELTLINYLIIGSRFQPVVVAEEEITTDPSNIFGDINTYKCNYTIDEWN